MLCFTCKCQIQQLIKLFGNLQKCTLCNVHTIQQLQTPKVVHVNSINRHIYTYSTYPHLSKCFLHVDIFWTFKKLLENKSVLSNVHVFWYTVYFVHSSFFQGVTTPNRTVFLFATRKLKHTVCTCILLHYAHVRFQALDFKPTVV